MTTPAAVTQTTLPLTPPAAEPATTPPAATTSATPPATATAPGAPATTDAGTQTQGQGTTTPAATPPADVELKLPEGMKADDAVLGKFKPLIAESGLKGEQAQKFLDLHVEGLKALQAAQKSGQEAEQKAWTEATKSDKEYGGAELEKNLAVAQKALGRFGGPGLVKFLEDTGLGNHPELIRAFYRAGKAISEDSLAATSPAPGTQMTDDQRRDVWFPTMKANP